MKGDMRTEVEGLGVLLADFAAAIVGLPEAVAGHVEVPGPDADEGLLRAQLALEQCRLLEHDVVDLLLRRDDGLPRRVHGQAGVDGGGPANLRRVEAEARVPEHPAVRRPPLVVEVQGGAELEAPMPMVGGGLVGEAGRRRSYEDDGHIAQGGSNEASQQQSSSSDPIPPARRIQVQQFSSSRPLLSSHDCKRHDVADARLVLAALPGSGLPAAYSTSSVSS